MKTNMQDFNAGDTVDFIDNFENYSSNDFDAKYNLVSKSGKIEFGSQYITEDNGGFSVNIPYSITASIPSETYQLNISFTHKTEDYRKSFVLKNIKVTNLSEQKDNRFWAIIALENVRACIANNASPLQKSYKYKDRELSNYDYKDLTLFEAYLNKLVKDEENKKNGVGKGFMVHMRYNKYNM